LIPQVVSINSASVTLKTNYTRSRVFIQNPSTRGIFCVSYYPSTGPYSTYIMTGVFIKANLRSTYFPSTGPYSTYLMTGVFIKANFRRTYFPDAGPYSTYSSRVFFISQISVEHTSLMQAPILRIQLRVFSLQRISGKHFSGSNTRICDAHHPLLKTVPSVFTSTSEI
jgi:hypothetical protein